MPEKWESLPEAIAKKAILVRSSNPWSSWDPPQVKVNFNRKAVFPSQTTANFPSAYSYLDWGQNRPRPASAFASPNRTVHLDRLSVGTAILSIDSGLRLKVDLIREGKTFVAFNVRFGVYGFGMDDEQALKDFKAAFIEFYADIVDSPEKELGDSALELKKTLLTFATLTCDG
ncbi:MAG: hypothetical protein KAT58_00650 [candidate division Zixibacteria bacterium]|nr:hypothetical protein [candidate division Zixibacteria bacterium]